MPISYTNRKGMTYHLCRAQTKTGAVRYTLTRQPQGDPVDEVPPGFRIRESVNGLVSLVKDVPVRLRPDEVAAVEAAIGRHPQVHEYRVDVLRSRIYVYEHVGAEFTELLRALGVAGLALTDRVERLQDAMERHASYAPVLRFVLVEARERVFRVERRCDLGGMDDWLDLDCSGPIEELAGAMIPRLGTEEFFELW